MTISSMLRFVCVICFPGLSGCVRGEDNTVRQPCILTFDSLSGLSSGSVVKVHQTLRDYLSCEWKTKMVPIGAEKKVFSKDNMVGASPEVQQQPNSSDCGIYLQQYI